MKTFKLLVLAAALAFSPACKKDAKKEEMKKDTTTTTTTTGSAGPDTTATGSGGGTTGSGGAPAGPDTAMAGSGGGGSGSATGAAAGGAPATPTEDNADWITVEANHFEKKDGDPVKVKFDKFKVTKANFDPKKIEGGTATIEIDLTSLKSGDAKRDEHLATPDYIDVKKFATAVVEISNVKKKDDKNFTADAKVKFHGVDKKYPVAFEVVDAKDDWIRIKGEQTFKRLDFKVGKKPGKDQKKGEDGVADEMTIKLQLTLKKT
ncbi:MAG TPA: YceI family protein [Kofleriaceae bacterium]|nr:YceI family protein [Kofleriaceae bacterium]